MKLYYAPGACSLAPHIVAREAGIKIDLDQLNWADMKTASGENFLEVNPKGYIPTLRLDDGSLLTETGVLIQYLADQNPEAGLIPKAGTMERYRVMEAINFVSTELHKAFGPLWNKDNTKEVHDAAKKQLAKRFDYLEKIFAKTPFITGDNFTVADAYLFTILNWTNFHAIDVSPWPKVKDFMARVSARPKVQEALKAEGLIK
jgi:glutathione S-transferase